MFASRRYHPVPQDNDSDGEEVTLYELTSSGRRADGDFGGGVYARDLDLDLPRPRVGKRPSFKPRPHSYGSRYNLVMGCCLFAVIMCVLLSVAVAVILYGLNYQTTPSGGSSPSSTASGGSHSSATEAEQLSVPSSLPPLTEKAMPSSAPPLSPSPHPSVVSTKPSSQPSLIRPTGPHTPLKPSETHAHPTEGSVQLSPTSTEHSEAHTSLVTSSESTSTTQLLLESNPTLSSTSLGSDVVMAMQTASEGLESLSRKPPPPNGGPATASPHATRPPALQPTPIPPPSPPSSLNPSISWERTFSPALTESSVQLYDMNRDGTLDVVVVDGFSQCAVRIVALDGSTGATVWQRNVSFESFAIRCELDVDSDGVPDCLVSGRMAGFVALSGVDGTMLWSVDPSVSYPHYNFFFPLITSDLDGDGVRDIINMHGGDPSYENSEAKRSPGFLTAISGRTGQKLMEPVPVPDGRETYMSPVQHTFDDQLEVILFGTGGETLPGSLWAVSMSSVKGRIREYVNSSEEYRSYEMVTVYSNHMCSGDIPFAEIEAARPKFDPSDYSLEGGSTECPGLGRVEAVGNTFGLCVYQLMKSREQGFMLPPVMVDMNGDGREDLVVTTFDGLTAVLDGRNATVVWEVVLPGTQTYRSAHTYMQ